jgi:hypothetical protein
MNFYDAAETLTRSRTGLAIGPTFLCCVEPVHAPPPDVFEDERRITAFDEYFDRCLDIFRASLRGEADPVIYKWLMNDTPVSLRRAFHLALPDAAFSRPRFFRTDESAHRRIFEIQCPGSGLGDLQLFTDAYRRIGRNTPELDQYHPAELFTREVQQIFGRENPSVLHLLDNSSAPISMRYLISATTPPLRYWGYSAGVNNASCDLVRSHSFFGLVSENRFKRRLDAAANGIVVFDLPPIVLFDQKAGMALPFWDKTRAYFSDHVRRLFAYTYPAGISQRSGYPHPPAPKGACGVGKTGPGAGGASGGQHAAQFRGADQPCGGIEVECGMAGWCRWLQPYCHW